jgi:hypothetical protein
MMRSEYHEIKLSRLVPFILMQAVVCLAIIIANTREYRGLVWLLCALMPILMVVQIRVALDKRPVLVITDESICLRGLRPGVAKIIQFWHQERILLGDIIDIRLGRIREDAGFLGLKLPPAGDQTSSSYIKEYLWIRYRKAGKQMELYYPHTPLIKNFEEALARLRQLRSCKIVAFG